MGTEDREGEKETEEIEAIVRFYIIDYLWFAKIHLIITDFLPTKITFFMHWTAPLPFPPQ